ncbi:hypothetical protein AC629_34725 [Bradyrhizobium sp. NAS80.1]|uniref:hypothetical protein n=1 Tax=Bradyrhizobium sp. NAS80.1 TaxID=1680159 RepID=UPI00095A2BC9|nr:hypothetical protein [Bradyrhizobium sp. NAS80.1]OKO74664.1 hypothetical protein AC629_34725 [Bradyrhizobium sp. NAS80.1]
MRHLAYAQFGLQTYQTVAAYLPKDKTDTSPTKSETSEPKQQGSKSNAKPKRKVASKEVKERTSLYISSNPATAHTEAANRYMKAAEKKPASNWHILPPGETETEVYIKLSMAELDQGDRAALAMGLKPDVETPTESELVWRGAELVKNRKFAEAIQAVLTPSSAGGRDKDMIDSFGHRNSMRLELLKMQAEFSVRRADQALQEAKREGDRKP